MYATIADKNSEENSSNINNSLSVVAIAWVKPTLKIERGWFIHVLSYIFFLFCDHMDTGSRKKSFNLFCKNIDVRLSNFSRTDRVKEAQSKYIYVICRPEGPYWEKLCQRSWVRPEASPKTEGTVFPNTDRPRTANNVFILFFRRVLCKQFLGWIFTAAIFKPGVRVRLTFRKMIAVVIWIHNCLFLR